MSHKFRKEDRPVEQCQAEVEADEYLVYKDGNSLRTVDSQNDKLAEEKMRQEVWQEADRLKEEKQREVLRDKWRKSGDWWRRQRGRRRQLPGSRALTGAASPLVRVLPLPLLVQEGSGGQDGARQGDTSRENNKQVQRRGKHKDDQSPLKVDFTCEKSPPPARCLSPQSPSHLTIYTP
ncbi:hypothetical protein DPMN_179406 [Dreissena polymorpha]|uniref:Uncharacterized protein n=1 Tax=Dreissena polymorpha TaxID=45954 RepID=A0A9D4EEG8_DREPO|nr:hypothetical protein DPMN_179406 [Dreissena polymorpha]